MVETESGVVTTVTYGYDNRRRLTRETRVGAVGAYDMEYSYDQGGNRLTKYDYGNDRFTTYTYDLDNPVLYGHKNNRLMSYDVRDGLNNVVERYVYEYALDGPATGNVTRVLRKVPDAPGLDPVNFTVYATEFFYNRASQVKVVSQRQWIETSGTLSPPVQVAIREVRGNGRGRYMIRDRDPVDLMPLPDTALWTAYDGDDPVYDYTATWEEASQSYILALGYSYNLGLAQVGQPQTIFDEPQTRYFHSDQIGTTRAMTDASSPPIVTRQTYTAYGEPVSAGGTLDTRYQYAGSSGYESFADLDWRTDANAQPIAFGFLHVGACWYDPSTGRFLQRDPMGIKGGANVYAYVGNTPTDGVDPWGLQRGLHTLEGGEPGHGAFRAMCAMLNEIETNKGRKPKFGDPDQVFPDMPSDWERFKKWLLRPRPTPPHRDPVRFPIHGGPGIGCFVGETIVSTQNGDVEINQITVGSQVLAQNQAGKTTVEACVAGVHRFWAMELVHVVLARETIQCTRDHPFWVRGRGWRKAAELLPGEELISVDGTAIPVLDKRIERLSHPVPVYNITVGSAETFFIGTSRVLVHNKNV